MSLSRRGFVQLAGTGFLSQSQVLRAEGILRPGLPEVRLTAGRSKVALIHGGDRRGDPGGATA